MRYSVGLVDRVQGSIGNMMWRFYMLEFQCINDARVLKYKVHPHISQSLPNIDSLVIMNNRNRIRE